MVASGQRFWAAVLCQPSSDFQESSKGKILRKKYVTYHMFFDLTRHLE